MSDRFQQAREARRQEIQALKQAHRLEHLVAERVVLTPDGMNRLKGLCPFHQERTPSFFVDLVKQTYCCYGASCGAHGDIVEYLKTQYEMTFLEAVAFLQQRSPDLVTPRRQPRQPRTSQEEQQAALVVALRLYQRDIHSRYAPQARQVLARRGLMPNQTTKLIEQAYLGYCTGARGEELVAELRHRGIAVEAAREVGLLSWRGTEELMAQRLIIPEIRQGQVIWMTGRWVGAGIPERKYLNQRGPRRLLGAEQLARTKQIVVIESPFDYLTLLLWGYPACAMDGGSIPEADLALFASIERVYLPHNHDEAGFGATRRLAKLFGSKTYSIFLPGTMYEQSIKDVNDMAYRAWNADFGADAFWKAGKKAVPWDDQLWYGAYTS